MVLWRPSQNNQRYAFTPLLDGDEDYSSDEEVLYNDAWDGMKMRGKGASRPDSPPSGTGREMESISGGPTFGDFVTVFTETLMQDVMVAKSWEIFTAIVITKKYCTMLLCTNGSVHCTVAINKSDPCLQNKGRIC